MRNWIVLRTCAFNWNAYFSVCVFCFVLVRRRCTVLLSFSSWFFVLQIEKENSSRVRWGWTRQCVCLPSFSKHCREAVRIWSEKLFSFFFSSFFKLSRKKACAPKDMIPNRHGHWDTLGTRWGEKSINKNKNNRHTIRSKQRDERHEIKIYNIFLTHIFFFCSCCCSTTIFSRVFLLLNLIFIRHCECIVFFSSLDSNWAQCTMIPTCPA